MNQPDLPIIDYTNHKDPYSAGRYHGEEFRTGIKELTSIRKNLMIQKNPALKGSIATLALKIHQISKKYDEMLARELEGIASGAGLALEDIIVLNNYTDFRDISMPEEGCSTVHVQRNHQIWSGQTWDMHSSAKRYICLIQTVEGLFFSLVGCLGMMGVNNSGHFLGVNNLNTTHATTGLVWPLLVRKVLQMNTLSSMKEALLSAPVTSGHNYMASSLHGGKHLEITPKAKVEVLSLKDGMDGSIFHTNHCLSSETKSFEHNASVNSTTHIRYALLKQKISSVQSFETLIDLLQDHENYPKSICSHFQSGLQDPATTCGGGACDFTKKRFLFWRGCPKDKDYMKEISFTLRDGAFVKNTA